MIEITYHNFKAYTLPNKLPAIYEFRFFIAPLDEYKQTVTISIDDMKRFVKNEHGILVVVKHRGTIGKFAWGKVLWMMLEACLLFSFIRWIVACAAINYWSCSVGASCQLTTSSYGRWGGLATWPSRGSQTLEAAMAAAAARGRNWVFN